MSHRHSGELIRLSCDDRTGVLWNTYPWPAALMMSVFAAFIGFGVRSLSEGYLSRLHSLLKTGAIRRGSTRELLGPVLRWITGGRRAAPRSLLFMVWRKQTGNFAARFLPVILQLLVIPVIGIVRGLGVSPFASGRLTPAYALPHLGGMIGLPIWVFYFATFSTIYMQ
jgi:hypothetical protein